MSFRISSWNGQASAVEESSFIARCRLLLGDGIQGASVPSRHVSVSLKGSMMEE